MRLDVQSILVGISLGADTTTELEATPFDLAALDQAIAIARVSGATIHIHHAIDWVGFDPIAAVPELASAAAQRAESRLAALTLVAETAGVKAQASATIGSASSELIDMADRVRAGLIVVGPRAHSTDIFGRLTHGSTAQRLARKAPCSVWIVHPSAKGPPARAAVLVDLKEHSAELIELGDWLREHLSVSTDLVHCVEFPADIALERLPNATDALRAYHADVLATATKRIHELLGDRRARWHIDLSDAWVTRVSEQLVQNRSTDLIVVAGTTKSGLAGVFLGNTAAKVVGRALCSTLVARPVASWPSPP